MSTKNVQFYREKTALKYFLIGRNYHLALKALGFAERYHVGLRKDGITPEFHHQVQIALVVPQLNGVINEELCIAAALLHDVQEDYQIPSEVIKETFGERLAEIVWRLTKKFALTVKNKEEYLQTLALDSEASLVKGIDRINNLQSMLGVFTHEKMKSYALEAEEKFLPMLKQASKLFPEQMMAYTTLQLNIKELVKWTNAYVAQQESLQASLDYANKGYATAHASMQKSHERERELEQKNYALADSIQDILHTTGFKTIDELAVAIKNNLVDVKQKKSDDDEIVKIYVTKILPMINEFVMSSFNTSKTPYDDRKNASDFLREKFRVALGISTLSIIAFNAKVTAPINES